MIGQSFAVGRVFIIDPDCHSHGAKNPVKIATWMVERGGSPP
jgi:hypothetical protein